MVLLDLSEFITITEDQVHVFVKSLKGANEDSAILQDTSHSIVNMLQHLAALSHSLKEVRKLSVISQFVITL